MNLVDFTNYVSSPAHQQGILLQVMKFAYRRSADTWKENHLNQSVRRGINAFLVSEHLPPLTAAGFTVQHLAAFCTAVEGDELMVALFTAAPSRVFRVMQVVCENTKTAAYRPNGPNGEHYLALLRSD
ncbi:MAG: hypothetical protein SGARI_007993, partial [Bacillariaceae sp.]